jgi:hypothetical protein
LNFDLVQLSGFTMEVIETAYAGHAKAIASTVDLSKFPDGKSFILLCLSISTSTSLFHGSLFFVFSRHYMCWW